MNNLLHPPQDPLDEKDPLMEYDEKQAELKVLLKQINAGLAKHDRDASRQGGHTWGHVGDLNRIVAELSDIRDRLHGQGEYKQ